jgi:quercetin dioxygenase-like cupin family protein
VTDRVDPRGRSEQPGIVSLHCFSSGPYYDPDNISFGPVVGVDEHRVEPGAGFSWHAHRGVQIASWVLEGTLRHEDSNGEVRFVAPGRFLVQSTGDGIRHQETNASGTEPLRFLQITVLGEAQAGVELVKPPATVGPATVDIRRSFARRFPAFVLVLRGTFADQDGERLGPGAARRLDRSEPANAFDADGDALALVLELDG